MFEQPIEKAVRKVRTAAGVRFFDAPIGTPITPGMVKMARDKHGDQKTDRMLLAQRRNAMRDNRRAFFANEATKRAKKRSDRLEANAAARESQRRTMATPPSTLTPVTVPANTPKAPAAPVSAPNVPAPAKAATHTDIDTALDLIHMGSWGEKDLAKAIAIVMKLRTTQNPEAQAIVRALRERMQQEEK